MELFWVLPVGMPLGQLLNLDLQVRSNPYVIWSAGNGSIMRLAPVPLFYAGDPEKAMDMAAESSRTTHGNQIRIDACRYLAGLVVRAVNGAGKEELLSKMYTPLPGYWKRDHRRTIFLAFSEQVPSRSL